MMLRALVLISTLSLMATACAEPPACAQLVERLCAAAGDEACAMLKDKGISDEASCRAVLDDTKALNAQLDALVAATAAKALNPAEGNAPPLEK